MRETTAAQHNARQESGFVLIAVLLMLAVLLSLLSAYSLISRIEISSNKSSGDAVRGFYAAEAALNLRAEEIRELFVGYNFPDGVSPLSPGECEGNNQGSGSYVCAEHELGAHTAVSYVTADPANPQQITIPPGELYQNLMAQEYRYTITSEAVGPQGDIEAMLELRFKSRLVPLFQFAAFYNKDLEILPGPHMSLNGPVHVNGDLYLNSDNGGLDLHGQVTVARGDFGGGQLFRGRKNNNSCSNTPVRIKDPVGLRKLKENCNSRSKINKPDVLPWNGMIRLDVPEVIVPEPEDFDPLAGRLYWDKADLRLVLKVNNSNNIDTTTSVTGVEVRNVNGTKNNAMTTALHNCPGSLDGNLRPIDGTTTFYNNREGKAIRMLDVDIRALFNCLYNTNWFNTGKRLDDSTEEGIVLYLTVAGPRSSNASSGYGVRVRNAVQLQSTIAAAPRVRKFTLVTDQASYTMGDFNAVNKIPAAIFSDSFNVLSNDWSSNDSEDQLDLSNNQRRAANTTIYAAVLSGTDTTGGNEGTGGQGGEYNGGLENYPRFHENWDGRRLTYRGSFVSLNRPRHADGEWVYGAPQYTAPQRDWHYETDFNNGDNLPPLTPHFVYLRQELFMRDFER